MVAQFPLAFDVRAWLTECQARKLSQSAIGCYLLTLLTFQR